jgi:signal transduction histidine kinase
VVLDRLQEEQAKAMLVLIHELRSPVNASKSLIAAMRYLDPEDTQFEFLMHRVEARLDQLLALVDDIIQVSQVKAGHPLGELVNCDLVAVTRAACAPYLEEGAARGLTMTVELPGVPVFVHMAERAYQLIVSNLVSNAVKYTPSGSVRVSLRQDKSCAILEVEDSGMGIPQDDMSQLFSEFFRATNARGSDIPGTGLGLASVKALVEHSGGELNVVSQEKKGSRFTVRLPLCKENRMPEMEHKPKRSRKGARFARRAMASGVSV